MATIISTVNELGKIITDAITAGNANNVPGRIERTTLIRVSTGRYQEVLPIIVPAQCCIMGDELRSVNVQPRTIYNAKAALTSQSDFHYSYKAIERLEQVIGNVVNGSNVTATSGNTRTQVRTWPYAETATVKPAAEKLARNIRRRVDVGLAEKREANYKKSYNMTTPSSVYGKHRDLLLLNKKFIQSEITGFITDNYPNLNYSRTKCKQDVGFILDALAYDLTYGGNWQSVKAGEAYYEGTNLQINSSETTATVAAYGYLKELVQTVGRGAAVSPVLNDDSQTQVTGTYLGGDLTTSAFAAARIQDVIDIINGGTGTETITYPSVSSVAQPIQDAYNNLYANMDVIGEKVIDFIGENFGTFKYKPAKCRRDLRKIITDVNYDIALGTNFNAVYSGLAYTRPGASTTYLLGQQKVQTIGAIRNARDAIKISVTTDGSSASGSSNSQTRVQNSFNEVVNIINSATPPNAYPGDGTVSALTFPSPTGVAQNRVDAKDNLVANRAFIQAELKAWVDVQIAANTSPFTSSFEYDPEELKREVGYIVDSQSYDILYGGNQATVRVANSYFENGVMTTFGSATQTAAAYARLATVLSQIVQETSVSVSAGNAASQTTPGTPASATEANEIDGNVQVIEDVITAGNLNGLPATTYPSITWADAEYETAHSNIESDKEDVIKSVLQYITNTYSGFVYDHAKCTRDLKFIAQAAGYDWMLGTNVASINAAYSYLREPSKKIVGDQKTATIAANEYARQLAIPYLGGNATALAGLNDTWQWVEDIIWSGKPEGGNNAVEDQEVWNAIRQLELNKEFLVDECVAYVENTFKVTATGTVAPSNQILIPDTDILYIGMPILFKNTDDSTDIVTNAGLTATTTASKTIYYVRTIDSSTAFTVSDTLNGAEVTLGEYGEGFIVEKDYTYDTAICKRDIREYINGIKWDLQWPQQWKRTYSVSDVANNSTEVTVYLPAVYKSRLGARYYVNAIIGSQEEDMYYLRNATGLRLQTLDGLRGDLGPSNAYGTQRPTAGSYASLDPGWGPNDQRVWITARSPYVQNVSTFGFAAIGQKIDGALHNGGNDSIVSNDFTQVISDGIGAWITNNGRAELVSVFSYYSHIGYLAEAGGRIRATNGNNSYGKFGSVAEGVDPDETAVTGIVDNKFQYEATISNVFTDAADEIYQLEYSHAGNEYTEAQIDIFGAGTSENLVQEDFRDEATFQVRVTEIDDSSGNPDAVAGGTGYLVVSNTAQTGSLTSLTLAATDGNLSTAYPGMKLIIIGGAGVGYYGLINTYNAGTKVATVVKESDGTAGWDHVIPGKTETTPNSSSTYRIEPAASFTAPAKSNSNASITSDVYPAVEFLETSAQYSNISVTSNQDGLGATFDIIRNGSKYYVTLNTAGSGYTRLDTATIAGSSVGGVDTRHDITVTVTAINGTGGITGFDFDGFGRRGRLIALPDSGTTARASVDGATWTTATLNNSLTWTNLIGGLTDDGSTTFKQSNAIAIGYTGGNTAVNYSTDTVTWAAPASQPQLTTTAVADVAFGQIAAATGRFVIIADNDRDVAHSDDGGQSWTTTTNALPSTGYTAIAYGQGKFVAVKSGTQNVSYSEDGITWTEVSTGLPDTHAWTDVVYGNGRFVCIANNNVEGAFSLDAGATWTTTTLVTDGGATPNKITYGQGMFVVTTDGDDTVAYSEYGTYWPTAYSLSTTYSGGLNAVAFINNDNDPNFVAIQGSTATNVAKIKMGATTKGRVGVANQKVFEVRITNPGSGYGSTAPTCTITDPNNINDVLYTVRIGDGVLAQPTFVARGSGFITATAEVNSTNSNGHADFFQNGQFVAVRQLSKVPVNGSNVVFDSLPGQVFKLVNTVSRLGTLDGTYTAFLQLSPDMEIEDTPDHADPVTLRIRFSQVRLTGHDFLDIGTGNFDDTNYPNEVYGDPVNTPSQTNETTESNGGRVFFTSTDQDGNFRVGNLFSIEQATGVATLNAEAFNIAGLQELSLGEVTLGGNSASITEFSTDPFFTANSDTVVPTQRAIKAYIEAQIGGGQASLIVNSVTAGDIFINTNQITTVSGDVINIKANVNFQGAVLGIPLAYNYFFR